MHRACLLVFLVAAVSGCGTVANLTGDHPMPYGGVQKDLECVASGKTVFDLSGVSSAPSNPWAAAFLLGLFAVEPPLSFLGDTVTLPYVLSLHQPEPRDEPVEQPRPVGFSTAYAPQRD